MSTHRRRRSHPDDPVLARMTLAAVALEFNAPELCLQCLQTRGSKHLIFCRQVSMYLLQTVFEMTMTRVAEIFARDRSTVSHALKVVEDTREDPVFNAKLEKMEDFLMGAQAVLGVVE